MTGNYLSAHIGLLRELRRMRTSLDALRASAEPGAQVLSGMPHAPGYEDRLGTLAVEIADLTTCIEQLERRVMEEETEINSFINTVPDAYSRTIFRLRFIHGMSWGETARAMGGRNTANGVRNVYYRWFKMCRLKSRDAVSTCEHP